ncbi:diguanylate cyclase [Saltatorellus ferox]
MRDSRAEERLRTLREVVDVMDEPAFVLRSDGVVMAANESLARLIDKDIAELSREHLDLVLGLNVNDSYRVIAALFRKDSHGPVHLNAEESPTGAVLELDASPMTLRKYDRAQFAFVRVRPDGNLADRLREMTSRLASKTLSADAIQADSHALERDIAALERLAHKDPLTGLENRGAFDKHLARVLGQALRDGDSAALIILDVDNFKVLNDTWGHDRGDECLRQLAKVLSSAARRPLDLVARVGGEEFAVILADCSLHNALAAASRIRRSIHAAALDHPYGRVTASIGVAATTPADRKDTTELYRAADRGLYEAKRSGKDRVCAGFLEDDKGESQTAG